MTSGSDAKWKVVVTEDIHPDGRAILEAQDSFEVLYADADNTKINNLVPEADAVLVRTLFLGQELLSQAPSLKIVSRHGVGCDNIAVSHLSERNIPMAIATDSNSISVVEHALMMICLLYTSPSPRDS